MGCCIMKGVTEQCMVRLRFTLLLKWRTQQALEFENRHRQFTREEIFEDDQMVYLLAPHSSALK